MIQKPQTTESSPIPSILTALKNGSSFCLSGHQNPDADVIGSQLALASLIRRLEPEKEKKIVIANSGDAPDSLSFLSGFHCVSNVEKVEGEFDVLLIKVPFVSLVLLPD